MSKQTAVEYLIEQLLPKALGGEQYYHIEIAKAMERKQMLDAVNDSWNMAKNSNFVDAQAEQYYNQTYGGNK